MCLLVEKIFSCSKTLRFGRNRSRWSRCVQQRRRWAVGGAVVQKGLQISKSIVVVSRRDGRGRRCSGADSRDHGVVPLSGYESSCIGGWHAALPDCAAYRHQRCHSSAVYSVILVAVVVSVVLLCPSRLVKVSFPSLSIATGCLLAGWWDAGVSVAWTFEASERTLHRCKACFTK